MDDKDMQYDFSKQTFPKRGLAYIIVNERFTAEGYPDRPGAYTDYKNMKNLFKPLNLKLMTYYDKTAKQIKDILRNASKRPDLAERPCFICVISSHGEQWAEVDKKEQKKTMEHAIVGVDGMRVLTKDLMANFSEDKCYNMVEKPKLFFIQACRETVYSTDHSQAVDKGVAVQYVVSAKLSKHRRMRQRLSMRTKYDNADSKLVQGGVPSDALDHIIDPAGNDESDDDINDDYDDDQFSDGYDTATTDEDSDADSDRETGHEELKNRDRSVYTDKNEDVVAIGDMKPEVQHIQAVSPTDQNKDVVPKDEEKPEVQHIQAISPTDQNKDVVPKDEEKPEVQHIQAVSPTDQNKDVVPKDEDKVQQKEAVVPSGVPMDKSDAGQKRNRMVTKIQVAEVMEVTAIPCHDDMLVMFASPPGKLAWRSTTEGGWLLANLYNVFKQYIRSRKISEKDFLTILTEVSQDVSLKETDTDDPKYCGMKMVPTIYHRLTKDVVLCADKETGLLRRIKEKISELIPDLG